MKQRSTLRYLYLFCLSFFALQSFENQAQYRRGAYPKPQIKARRFYDQSGFKKKNSVRMQALSAIETARFSYERILGFKFSAGMIGSYQFANEEAGTIRIDGLLKYFFAGNAPMGMYMFASTGFAQIQGHPFVYRVSTTENGEKVNFDPTLNYSVTKPGSFATYIHAVGLGYQALVGPEKNFILDFSLGYQHISVPVELSRPIVQDGYIYGQFDANHSLLGPTSPVQVRIGFGMLF